MFRAALLGGGLIPTPLLAELLRNGATLKPLPTPCTTTERHYRPSTRLERFVRARDLTCRFPGCGAPAERCDLDHTIPYPTGPTHPSNIKCLCRKHHLAKTFWNWTDHQLPDGTVVWTSPSGHTYTTHPGSPILLPHWNITTTPLTPPTFPPSTTTNRTLMMPRRKYTRTTTERHRIQTERRLNNTS